MGTSDKDTMTRKAAAPPYSEAAEASVLSTMMASPEAALVIAGELSASDFFKPSNGVIFETIRALVAHGDGCDPISVMDELGRRRALERVGGEARILELFGDALAPLSWRHHVDIVKRCSAARRVLDACARVSERAAKGAEDYGALVADAIEELRRAGRAAAIAPARTVGDLLGDSAGGLFVPCGIDGLDAVCGGFPRGGVTVLAGAAGAGKSSLADDAALGCAAGGHSVALFSLDSKAAARAASLARGYEREAAQLDIAIDDSPAPLIEQVESRARRMLLGARPDLVVVDYLQLLELPAPRPQERVEACAVRHLRAAAARLDAAFLVLAQAADGGATRALSEHADVMLLLDTKRAASGYAGRVVKNRLGSCGRFEVDFGSEESDG